MRPATVLVVDDSPDIRAIVRRTLTVLGYIVIEATSGHEAIGLARRCRPALVLLDLCLPGLDGWEVTRALRAEPALDEIPIVAMTGYGVLMTTRPQRGIDVQRIVYKPFDLGYLERTVATLAARAAS
jgi:CheY-like chemotaxis protein